MDELFIWFVQNAESIGVVTVVIVIVVVLTLALSKEIIVPGYYHRKMIAGGDEAIATLKEVNPKLAEFQTAVAVQQIRDEFGARELDEVKQDHEQTKRELAGCLNDLATCRRGTHGGGA